MADNLEYYLGWKHEYNRAVALGKGQYKINCEIELARLEAALPAVVGKNCDCAEFPGCTGPA